MEGGVTCQQTFSPGPMHLVRPTDIPNVVSLSPDDREHSGVIIRRSQPFGLRAFVSQVCKFQLSFFPKIVKLLSFDSLKKLSFRAGMYLASIRFGEKCRVLPHSYRVLSEAGR
jgi:hypothetical protein